jgi:serine/threonine protein kinase
MAGMPDPDLRDRFSREVSLLGRVGGRCVARIVDADPGGAPPWFATEYLPGPTLDRRIDRHGPMSGDELHGLAVGLAEALVALHSREVSTSPRPAACPTARDVPRSSPRAC